MCHQMAADKSLSPSLYKVPGMASFSIRQLCLPRPLHGPAEQIPFFAPWLLKLRIRPLQLFIVASRIPPPIVVQSHGGYLRWHSMICFPTHLSPVAMQTMPVGGVLFTFPQLWLPDSVMPAITYSVQCPPPAMNQPPVRPGMAPQTLPLTPYPLMVARMFVSVSLTRKSRDPETVR